MRLQPAFLVLSLLMTTSAFADEADEHLRVLRVAYCLWPEKDVASQACSAGMNIPGACKKATDIANKLTGFVGLHLTDGTTAEQIETLVAVQSGQNDSRACAQEISAGAKSIPEICDRQINRCKDIDALLPY